MPTRSPTRISAPPPAPRFAEERQQAIARVLKDDGRVEVAALAAQWGVSEDSIRRDLRALAARGLVQKTHGGAIALQLGALPMARRVDVKAAAKDAIAAAAAAKVQPHQTLFIDSGTTTLALARALCAAGAPRPLTVVTASLDVATLLAEQPQVALWLAGGAWSPDTRSFVGEAALAELQRRRADWAFLGACAVHSRLGLSASDRDDALLKRAMLAGAAQRVLLADASKFDRVQPHAVAGLDQLDLVISDAAPKWLRGAARVERI